MRIDFKGNLVDEREIRVGFIGCGSHSFRNIYPVFQYVKAKLVATCDLSLEKAKAYASEFGAENAYNNYKEMLVKEELDAVFVVTGYNEYGRPMYPQIVIDCLDAGCHVWIEKPPAATCDEIRRMQEAADKNNKKVQVGYKKMFFPANEKAKELSMDKAFGNISLVTLQYPQSIPTAEDFHQYVYENKNNISVMYFLDHLCHPVSLMVYLMGMPSSFYYQRSHNGAGVIIFSYSSGAIVSLALTEGSSYNGGMERTAIISDNHKHITIENNIRLSYHQDPPNLEYGKTTSYFSGEIGQTTAIWEPEFSLGNLYNKGLFLLGYYNEINEFVQSVLENRAPSKGTLEQAYQITRIFEKFIEGPGKVIEL